MWEMFLSTVAVVRPLLLLFAGLVGYLAGFLCGWWFREFGDNLQ